MADGMPEARAGDERLIALARQGNGGAWETLVRGHQEAVFRLAYLITGSAADADDVAQETFVRAFLKLGQYDDTRPLRPWLLGITSNLARNRRRSLGRYRHMVLRFLQANREETAVAPPADRSEARELWGAVRRLPPAAGEIIYLRYFVGLSEQETAETLKIAPGTVKSRTHRALRKLRPLVEDYFPELADERRAR